MSDIPPPEQPGWYADAHGAWWWWDGGTWTPAPTTAGADPHASRSGERTLAMVMWIVFMVGGGWISSLIFYLVSKDKLFVRHHAAETLNLTLVQLPLQILAMALVIPDYISYISDTFDDSTAAASFGPAFYVGLTLFVVLSLLHYGLCIAGIIHASRARWWRLPLPLHPVRGVVAKGEEPYSVG